MDKYLVNILLLFNTLRHLKIQQIIFQSYYRIFPKSKGRLIFPPRDPFRLVGNRAEFLPKTNSFSDPATFTFLNRRTEFAKGIDWSFNRFGKLWTYNLNYFDYINQSGISEDACRKLINSYLDNYNSLKDGLEPYPTSLRIMNLIQYQLRSYNKKFDTLIYSDTSRLLKNLEYHLMGNHLLENGFAIVMAGYYFSQDKWIDEGERLLSVQLEEQIRGDGAHFELSPMYHTIILSRIMDILMVYQTLNTGESSFIRKLRGSGSSMLTWLNSMTFSDGTFPLVNDAALGITYRTSELEEYGKKVGVAVKSNSYITDTYRMIRAPRYELFIDVNAIGPSYQPGHAHADTFNFVLHIDGKPSLVDTGTSTYEAGSVRAYERSTAAHNTVEIGGVNSSEVWSSFRVARRANVIALEEGDNFIKAVHDGYKRMGSKHKRSWTWTEESILIDDAIIGRVKEGFAYFHLHPDVEIREVKPHYIIIDQSRVTFSSNALEISDYQYAPQFNVQVSAKVIKVFFRDHLKTRIDLL